MSRRKHAPGDTGPECGEKDFVFPRDIAVTLDEEVTCGKCRVILARRGECPECHETGELAWDHSQVNVSGGVVDGRLTMHDVITEFHLGCQNCSATVLSRVHPNQVAEALTANGWRP